MSKEERAYDSDFFKSCAIIARIAGVSKPDPEDHWFWKFCQNFWNIFCMTTNIILFMCECALISESLVSFSKLLALIGMLASHAIGLAKMGVVTIYREKIKYLCHVLQAKEFEYERSGDFYPDRIFKDNLKLSRNFACVLFIIYWFVGIWSQLTCHNNLKKYELEIFAENVSCKDFMQYPAYVPLNPRTKDQCWWTLMYFQLGMDLFAFWIAAHDIYFNTLLNCLKTQFEILGGAFVTLRNRCLKKLGKLVDNGPIYDVDDPHIEKAMYKEVRHCTLHLMALLNVHQSIENLFTFIVLTQAIIALLNISLCLFVIATTSLSTRTISQGFYLLAILQQFGWFCYFGNEVTIASSNLIWKIAESNWLASSRRFKICIQINMIRLHKNVYLTIGKFSPLTLTTFVSVCRASLSYFAVLKNVYTK